MVDVSSIIVNTGNESLHVVFSPSIDEISSQGIRFLVALPANAKHRIKVLETSEGKGGVVSIDDGHSIAIPNGCFLDLTEPKPEILPAEFALADLDTWLKEGDGKPPWQRH